MKFSGILIGGWVAAGAALTLAGCSGSSGSDSENPAPSPTSTIETDGALPECTTGAELAAQLSDPRVTQVEVTDDCRSVTVSTGLAADHADLAVLVCDAAGELAYPDAAVSTISVTGEDGSELATGLRDQACAAA